MVFNYPIFSLMFLIHVFSYAGLLYLFHNWTQWKEENLTEQQHCSLRKTSKWSRKWKMCVFSEYVALAFQALG